LARCHEYRVAESRRKHVTQEEKQSKLRKENMSSESNHDSSLSGKESEGNIDKIAGKCEVEL
jgi:hypothetical protein